jgi:hypothetical protein
MDTASQLAVEIPSAGFAARPRLKRALGIPRCEDMGPRCSADAVVTRGQSAPLLFEKYTEFYGTAIVTTAFKRALPCPERD